MNHLYFNLSNKENIKYLDNGDELPELNNWRWAFSDEVLVFTNKAMSHSLVVGNKATFNCCLKYGYPVNWAKLQPGLTSISAATSYTLGKKAFFSDIFY